MDVLFDAQFRQKVMLTRLHEPHALKPMLDVLSDIVVRYHAACMRPTISQGQSQVLIAMAWDAQKCVGYITELMPRE